MHKGDSEQFGGSARTTQELPPRPLAEHVAPDIAIDSLKHYMTRKTVAGHFRSAWQHVEYALNQQIDVDSDIRRKYLNDATWLLGSVMRRSKNEDIRLGALTLGSYMPCIDRRASGNDVTADDCDDIYKSLGHVMAYCEPHRPQDQPRWRLTETIVLALSARTRRPDLLLYPSSPREEASAERQENHDSYFIYNDTKLPVQQKSFETPNDYSDHITLVTLQPMTDRAYKKARISQPDYPADMLDDIVGLIVAETHGVAVQPSEKLFLDTLTSYLAWHYYEARATVVEAA